MGLASHLPLCGRSRVFLARRVRPLSNCRRPFPNHPEEKANQAVTISDSPSLASAPCIPSVKAWHLAAVYALAIAYASLMQIGRAHV